MQNVPGFVYWLFAITAVTAVGLFYTTAQKSKTALIVLSVWLGLQAALSLAGFYTLTKAVPPRFPLLVLPPVLFIIVLFTTAKGRRFVNGLDLKLLTIFHVIRVPVEIVLLLLYQYNAVPQMLTFEGGNFDILSGITAPIVYYFGFVKKRMNKGFVIVWNIICLALLANVVTRAVLSAPLPFQHFAFDQPNIAVLYFPFAWLPCCVVPLVLFCHLAALRRLLVKKS